MSNLFASASMSEGYAKARPPIHPIVVDRVLRQLQSSRKFRRVLDVGCGAGLSTRPLLYAAELVIAVDPVEAMVRQGPSVAHGAHFLTANAEALPIASNSMNLITAAGSFNYADLDLVFLEASRVLTSDGLLLVYDFSQGKRFRSSDALAAWFETFLARFPAPPEHVNHLDGPTLGTICQPLCMYFHEPFEVGLPWSMQVYINYLLTETNISHAVSQGAKESDIRSWCEATLAPVFAEQDQEVLFDGYFACMGRP